MRQYRSFFWPGLLILIGVLALLANTNVISVERLDRLTDLWPVILVVIGLLLIVRRTPMPAATEAIAAGVILLLARSFRLSITFARSRGSRIGDRCIDE